MSVYIRTRFHDLKRLGSTPQILDSIWGDILVHRQVHQDYCSELITTAPTLANTMAVDRHLWRIVYYDVILECRKRLGLQAAHSNSSQSQGSSIVGSMRSSELISSSSRATSLSADIALEEWQREWWSVVLTTLFNEALGYFQSLYSLVTAQMESKGPLSFAVQYLRTGAEAPSLLQMARRLLVYVGDIYRYQAMYLPQLAYGSAGPIDATRMFELARSTYGRAMAMHFDSGRACMQMSLVSACAQQRFMAMFWHVCGLCYADYQHMHTKAMALVTRQENGEYDEDDGPIEALVVELASAVVVAGRSTDASYWQLLDALNADLEEMRRGAAAVNLDAEFWEREYQLGVALAALLTVAEGRAGNDAMRVQELAAVLVRRQAMWLQQALELGESKGSVYAAVSICVWVDVWRSTTILSDWLVTQAADGGQALVGQLARLAESSSGGALDYVAQTVLAHDVALMGWRTLRSVQQTLRYEEIGRSELWRPDASDTVRVVLARVQLLMLAPGIRGGDERPCVVPDLGFWTQRLAQVQKWAQAGGKYRVVLAAAVQQQLEADGGVAARAALAFARAKRVVVGEGLAHWESDAMAYLAEEDDDDGERPVAADVPEEARGVVSCALAQRAAVIATTSEETAFYASWFRVGCVESWLFS
ncbi:hypothetical protein GGI20_003332 [Coemansia sp. BCRC 34301]|nr:hypothetical protein GGI20_003332 [Coemansia sp. BCRC 34301]